MRRAFAIAIGLALVASVSPAQASGIGGACRKDAEAVAAYRGQGGRMELPGVRVLASGCDFLVHCPPGTPGGCAFQISVRVEGEGLVEVALEGPFGTLWCGPAMGECEATEPVFLPAGTIDAAECSVTGLAVEVEYVCSAFPR